MAGLGRRGRDPLSDLLQNPKHWRDRAAEARAQAEQIASPDAKKALEQVALGYDRLADKAEERLRHKSSG